MIPLWVLATITTLFATLYLFVPRLVQALGAQWGDHIRRRTAQRRHLILQRAASEKREHESTDPHVSPDGDWEKVDKNNGQFSNNKSEEPDQESWHGVVGFFHPFCNAGGGGERVLWAAIRATQQKWPNALCAVYTGDHNVTKEQILQRVQERFNIHLHPPTVCILYLSTRNHVLSSTWPYFTLLGQSLGSIVLGYEALNILVPDAFVDTMGYAFTHALSKFLFPKVPVGAYVHYPTISTDMLDSLDAGVDEGKGLNSGSGSGWKGDLKKKYWHLFAKMYGWVGGSADVVMTNSSWTQAHIQSLWGGTRTKLNKKYPIEVVFPPCAVEELEREIDVSATSEKNRKPELLYIAQFRPEKNHQMILKAFAQFLNKSPPSPSSKKTSSNPQLILIGSVRDSTDETYIYSLRLLAHELKITQNVTFLLNASWPSILSHLQTASVGVNGMWNEHFGIGVVEYQAAGLISVVNNSGGPKHDIVVNFEGKPTGYHASNEEDFAEGFEKALGMGGDEMMEMRLRARKSAKRFSEEAFEERWKVQMERIVELVKKGEKY